jgi:hypothetical protein
MVFLMTVCKTNRTYNPARNRKDRERPTIIKQIIIRKRITSCFMIMISADKWKLNTAFFLVRGKGIMKNIKHSKTL